MTEEIVDPCLATLSEKFMKKKGLTFIKVMYKGNPLHALLDTGSTVSLVGDPLFDKFPQLKQSLKPSSGYALSVNSSKVKFSGELDLPFTLDSKNCEVTLKYLAQMPYSLLLGTDFLKQYGACIDFDKQTVTFPTSSKVCIQESIELQPGETLTTYGIVECPPPADSIAVVVPLETLKESLETLPVVVKLTDSLNLVPIGLTNSREQVMVLEEGDHVAALELVTGTDSIYDIPLETPSPKDEGSSADNPVNRSDFEKCFT